MNFDPKGMIQYGKTGLMMLRVGKGAFSLLRQRLHQKHKIKKLQMKRNKNKRKQQQKNEGFFSAIKGVKMRAKIGLKVLFFMKERYL
ncbi:hypothetical protein [Anaerotignum sp.]|uniref:hypothetical protein n=1 Tax=Anaerotignum sp. TaxID=2039241 RepID=UPI00331A116D